MSSEQKQVSDAVHDLNRAFIKKVAKQDGIWDDESYVLDMVLNGMIKQYVETRKQL